ncbi:nucleotidyltransferase [Clostridium cylindrosporum]|uniref:tRNA(Met) cytidine acetate ligase n=1 Tax=Clostridium cylindrosporum DSM 605 TaxID=1121307 RepID=A0A0J8G126_CLOCY|nr:nucleotidyltransferase [Clostridium cylindrosporum]KMT21471.1 hypothetical protein CLCY_2c02310 [Clostridium cylindrosporum DSM 605]
MKVCGIIVEYNPMHNGHIYHIKKAKDTTSCSHLIAVMSGNFVQRGEPGIVNKWTRAEMALNQGVDLVIELPFINSISSAEGFCYSSVKILDSLNIVDNICFGSEEGSLESLKFIAKILVNEPLEYKNILTKYLDAGISFPSARQYALNEYIKDYTHNLKDLNFISYSNNILSVEYLKALLKLNSRIEPVTIERINNSYKEINLTGEISSATSIRNNILNIHDIKNAMPYENFDLLSKDFEKGLGPVSLNSFSDIIMYKLRECTVDYLESLVDVSEGLENKIKKASENFSDVVSLINEVSGKRYPKTRIQRILLYALFGITRDVYKNYFEPTYVRVLGFNEKGREILSKIKKTSSLPIISMPNSKDIDSLKYDILSSDIYSLAYSNIDFKTSKKDLKTPPIYIKN